MDDLDLIVQHGCFAADGVTFILADLNISSAEMTRRQLQVALRMLIGNGLIQITPREEWPEYVVLDPPYKLPEEVK